MQQYHQEKHHLHRNAVAIIVLTTISGPLNIGGRIF